ncbi:RAD9, HUS1, RAD1-interacting nuclear orphan protein 1 [Astyanax mexicanus]|uniref:Si:ch73-352p4.5 n=1 Tax=Astyanax mexicanus TaxID=7994 RepID=A0A8B9LBY3_ASTMX|nr:RAD9, HUS1, RAD1-interacting nuclear orphan protein 1 [Astyanax mexicanus]
MPRQTRRPRLPTPQKSHLLFVEQPRNGTKHEYGHQLRSAINPRSFIAEETSRKSSSVSSWVSPQFISQNDTAVRRGGRRRKKNRLPTNTMNTTSALSLHQVKRATAGRYSSLSFRTSTSVSQRHHGAFHKNTASRAGELPKSQDVRRSQSDKTGSSLNQNEVPEETPRQGPSLTERGQKRATPDPTLTPNRTSECVKTPLEFIHGKGSTVRSHHRPAQEAEDTSSSFTPPHVETPEIPHSVHCLSSPVLSIPFFTDQPSTQNMSVLVKDTPERDYGLKVTWRRRKKLMNLLSERGQLLVSEAMISRTWL